MSKKIHLTLTEAYQLAEQTLLANHFSLPHAQAIAENVTAGERDGCASHGLYRILVCVHSLRSGKVSPDALPNISTAASSLIRADAKGAFSLLARKNATPLLIEKTQQNGIAALAINHCLHYSALWMDIEPLTDVGLVALAFTPNHAWVTPAGGKRPVFGTNPIAFGWPRPNNSPFIFDLATSMIARGEIELHRRVGKPIPIGWGVDEHGNNCTNAARVLDKGAMLTFGDYKGSALSAMVELLSGPLIGDLTSIESLAFDEGTLSSPKGGELIIAIDPAIFMGSSREQSNAMAEAMFMNITSQGLRLPSQRRYQARQRSLQEGVWISEELFNDIQALAH